MTSFGCVLPLAPAFEDPPEQQNYPPSVVSTEPPQGIVQAGTLSVTVTDPNVSDDLYIRWIGEFPPYTQNSHLLKDDTKVQHSADGSQLLEMRSLENLNCLSLASQTALHPVTALVTDRPFPDPAQFPNLSREDLLTKLDDHGAKAEAHWTVNVSCP
jgi:hypothetical protein